MEAQKNFLKNIIPKILKTGAIVLFSISFFWISVLIGHVFDLDFIDPQERYHLDPDHNVLTFDEWQARESQRVENFNNYVLDGLADSLVFPPWKNDSENNNDNISSSCHHNERD